MSHKHSFIFIFACFAAVRFVFQTPCLLAVIDSCGSLFPCCLLLFSDISMGHRRFKGRPMVRPDGNNIFAYLFSQSQLETKFTTFPSFQQPRGTLSFSNTTSPIFCEKFDCTRPDLRVLCVLSRKLSR